MADSPAFSWVCEELERLSDFDRLEARGTVRLAIKASGLEPRSVTPPQMQVVISKRLPAELKARGIESSDSICSRLATGLKSLDVSPTEDSPDEIFRRLGQS